MQTRMRISEEYGYNAKVKAFRTMLSAVYLLQTNIKLSGMYVFPSGRPIWFCEMKIKISENFMDFS